MNGIEFIFMVAILMIGVNFKTWIDAFSDGLIFANLAMFFIIGVVATAVIWT